MKQHQTQAQHVSDNHQNVRKGVRPVGKSPDDRKYRKVEYEPAYSEYQEFLYQRALKGLKVYTEEEVRRMRPDKLRRIEHVHQRARSVLNIWKQEIMNVMCARLFMDLFPPEKNRMTRDMIESVDHVDPEWNPKFSFREVGVSKHMIVRKLYDERVLPRDFYELS